MLREEDPDRRSRVKNQSNVFPTSDSVLALESGCARAMLLVKSQQAPNHALRFRHPTNTQHPDAALRTAAPCEGCNGQTHTHTHRIAILFFLLWRSQL